MIRRRGSQADVLCTPVTLENVVRLLTQKSFIVSVAATRSESGCINTALRSSSSSSSSSFSSSSSSSSVLLWGL